MFTIQMKDPIQIKPGESILFIAPTGATLSSWSSWEVRPKIVAEAKHAFSRDSDEAVRLRFEDDSVLSISKQQAYQQLPTMVEADITL